MRLIQPRWISGPARLFFFRGNRHDAGRDGCDAPLPARVFQNGKQEKLNACFSLNRLPPAVRSAPERFDAAHSFPEAAYLRRHLDLRAAIREGRIASAFEHYPTHGYAEGRVL